MCMVLSKWQVLSLLPPGPNFLFYSQESKSREERGLPTARGSSAGNAAAMCDPGVVSAAVTAPGLISYHTCLRPRRAMPI